MFIVILDESNHIIFHIHLLRQGFGFLRYCVWKYFPYTHDFKSGTNEIVRIACVGVVGIAIVVHIAERPSRRYQAEPLSFLLLLSDCLQPFIKSSSRSRASIRSSVNLRLTENIDFICSIST